MGSIYHEPMKHPIQDVDMVGVAGDNKVAVDKEKVHLVKDAEKPTQSSYTY